MELYIDTANLDEIKQAHDLGVLDGVTTNPSLIAKEGVDYGDRLAEICEVVSGPVSAEVIATEADAMITEGKMRAGSRRTSWSSSRARWTGARVQGADGRGHPHEHDAVLPAAAGADGREGGAFLVSPFIGRIDDIGLRTGWT
jgi:transaldolase